MPGIGASPRPRKFIVFSSLIWLALILPMGAGQVPSPFRPPPAPPVNDLDLILAYVTVTAAKNAAPPRLAMDDFHILEDGQEQKIDYFAVQNQPMSIGIVWGGGTGFDAVGPPPDLRECPRVFVRNSVPMSEYFLLQGDKVTTSYTTDPMRIPQNFAWSNANSDTVFIGMDVLKEAANPRKILLVIMKAGGGGGGQLQTDYVERAATALSSHGGQATQVHILSFSGDAIDFNGPASIFLNELAELTGGSYTMSTVSSVVCANLAKELRTQYMIGYHPTNKARDGKWRKMSIKVNSPQSGPKLSARIKRGYYAAKTPR
jgi:Ca-activated chloride channel family protein